MIPTPIHKILSTFQKHGVRALLMGGQACVLYGAAQFSKDADFLLLADEENFERLFAALKDLRAERIAIPPFDPAHLARGHAVHFRCQHPEAPDLRIDIMTRLRAMPDFATLWERRVTFADETGLNLHLLDVPDLVEAKKTQRDKDWPVIALLVDIHYRENGPAPTPERIRFWLGQSRTSETLLELVRRFPKEAVEMIAVRPLLAAALAGDVMALREGLEEEERRDRQRDREYWAPLKAEMEAFRRAERAP